MSDDQLRWHIEAAGVRLQLAEDQREQTGLATAIRADDTDLLATIDRERRVGDKQPRTAAQGQAVKRELCVAVSKRTAG
jgi:hypothetical protein